MAFLIKPNKLKQLFLLRKYLTETTYFGIEYEDVGSRRRFNLTIDIRKRI